ncbi:MAG: hypothetical protein R6T98_09210 [Desulfatiglandales bacterium]
MKNLVIFTILKKTMDFFEVTGGHSAGVCLVALALLETLETLVVCQSLLKPLPCHCIQTYLCQKYEQVSHSLFLPQQS